jgi:DNA-binding XRE family transcriptional regulator
MDPAAKALNQEVGRRLRDFRRLRSLTQKQIADMLGVTFQQVQKYEKGENALSAAWIKRYAEILGVTINHILGEDNTEVPQTGGPPISICGSGRHWTRLSAGIPKHIVPCAALSAGWRVRRTRDITRSPPRTAAHEKKIGEMVMAPLYLTQGNDARYGAPLGAAGRQPRTESG